MAQASAVRAPMPVVDKDTQGRMRHRGYLRQDELPLTIPTLAMTVSLLVTTLELKLLNLK